MIEKEKNEKKGKKGMGISKNMLYLIISLIPMFIFLFLAVGYYVNGYYQHAEFLIGLAFVSLMPFGVIDFLRVRGEWKYNIDMIRFLQDLAGYANTGMPMHDALLEVAKNNYGYFDRVVKKIKYLLLMHVSVEEALNRAFSDKSRNNEIVRSLLIEANRVGGDVGHTLTGLADSFTAKINAKKQEKATVSSYMMVAIIGFGVYLFTIALIFQMLFPEFAKLSGATSGTTGLSMGAGLSMSFFMLPQFEFFVLLSVIILGFFTGLVSSTLRDNSYYSGFFYGGIFVIITLIMQALLWGI